MDLTDYKLVFEDDFEGDTLDTEKWSYRSNGPRRCGINSPTAVRVENGKLIISYDWRDGEYGEGWYSGMIRANKRFCKGYFEIRCICSAFCNDERWESSPWSAFWLQADHPYEAEISKGGPGGAEIDIIEAMGGTYYPGVSTNIHLAGKAGSTAKPGELDSLNVGGKIIPDCATAFHTYGLEWTDEIYRFYVDGECFAESTWGDGVSQVDEELVVSLEHPVKGDLDHDFVTEFIVDYVKVWQK